FEDNQLLAALFGPHDRYLARIEQRLGVQLSSRGNVVVVDGKLAARDMARHVLTRLYQRLKEGLDIGPGDVDGAIRMEQERQTDAQNPLSIRTRQRTIVARSPNQQRYLELMQSRDLVFALGPAGTGKTYLAVAAAVSSLMRGERSRIILSRPAVEAGERLGFLPGDLREKVDPYLRPLYDALYDMLPAEQVERRLETGEIEIAPLAFMRGRTLSNAFIIIDEAQNTTPMQMKMLLTRLGENARMIVTGDLTQIDLPRSEASGLREATGILKGVEGIGVVEFEKKDVVRHPLVARMVEAYEAHENQDGNT
ncbi:MAG: PhoH family protein, partial [Rhodospirillaceae bacterium]|nr:PhoH family protein [Rhodospirillaceae bacterium]